MSNFWVTQVMCCPNNVIYMLAVALKQHLHTYAYSFTYTYKYELNNKASNKTLSYTLLIHFGVNAFFS